MIQAIGKNVAMAGRMLALVKAMSGNPFPLTLAEIQILHQALNLGALALSRASVAADRLRLDLEQAKKQGTDASAGATVAHDAP